MRRFLFFTFKFLASISVLLCGSALFVVAQQLEKPEYTTHSLQLFIEYMVWNILLLVVLSFISVLVSNISKHPSWGIATGIIGSLFFFLGRKDSYILDGLGMGLSALLIEILTVIGIVLLLSFRRRKQLIKTTTILDK